MSANSKLKKPVSGGFTGRLFVPLAFATFPFVFVLQVVSGTELFGVMPYLFLLISALLVNLSPQPSTLLIFRGRTGPLDSLVIVLVLWSLSHALAGLVLGTSTFEQTTRVILIYVASAWVYFYVVFYSGERDHQDILIAVALSTLVLGVHWCVETVSKFVLHRISMYQILTADYIMQRNQLSYEQLNKSVLYPEYRAYGLKDKHTTTGALVSLGGFATVSLLSRLSLDRRIIAGCVFLTILTVGMATLAWLSFLLLVPFAILLSERLVAPGKVMLRGTFYCLGLGAIVLILGAVSGLVDDLLNKITWLYSVQLSFVLNIDGSSAQTSWWQIYSRYVASYGQYIAQNPWSLLFGEGYLGYSNFRFLRGGDVALFEFLAIYGFPLSLFILVSIFFSVVVCVRTLIGQSHYTMKTCFLTFSCVGLIFLLFSLAHYNTLFNKSIFIFLFLFLGLVRRYGFSLPKRRYNEGPQPFLVGT
jgi:hypothetical protein